MAQHTGFPPLDARPILHRVLPTIAVIVIGALLLPANARAEGDKKAEKQHAKAEAGEKAAWHGDAYPYDTCVVSGEKLGGMGDPIVMEHEGREVRFCCDHCVEPYKKDTAKYTAALDAKLIADQADSYPLDTCVVSGEPMGSMGEPDVVVVGNRVVKLCCDHCRDALEADTAKYMAKLDEAIIAAQMPDYPMDACVVSGEPLEGGQMKPMNVIVNGRLVRLCCRGCKRDFAKNPAAVLAKVDEAAAEETAAQ